VDKRKRNSSGSARARLTATDFRSRLYGVLDEVAETGMPYEVVRGEQRFLIVPADPPRRRLAHLPKRPFMTGTLEELAAISFDWEPPADD
jgi:hypothetical protein